MTLLRVSLTAGLVLAALSATGQTPDKPPPRAALAAAAAAREFWAAVDELGLIFKAVGNLGGGLDRGQLWRVDLATGEQHAIVAADALAWPVLSHDGTTIFALREGRLVRVGHDGHLTPVGTETQWRKLVGVDGRNNVLGFIAGKPRVHPALMSPSGELLLLPQPETESERDRVSQLLQENRAYADGRQLLVKRSARGGRGFDVSIVTAGKERALSNCGDDLCGQPSLSPDGHSVLYVRAPAP